MTEQFTLSEEDQQILDDYRALKQKEDDPKLVEQYQKETKRKAHVKAKLG